MTNKIIEFDVNDERAGKIAEVIGNKTAKKILNLLADREMSEGDISRELGIPLNTVGYNIKNLIEAGFIEKTPSYFWSVKGKKIPTYKLANKKIIISTKTSFKGVLSSAIIGGLVLGGFKVFSNYSLKLATRPLEKIKLSDSDITLSVASSLQEKAMETFTGMPVISSIWQNVWIWVLAGVIIGLGIYSLFKLLKGGLNN